METIASCVYDTSDASLNDKFGAFDARLIGNVERSTIGIVMAACQLGDGIGFRMEDVGFRDIVFFADVFESGWCAIIAVAYDHLVLDDKSSNLTSLAIRIFSPNGGHTKVSAIENCCGTLGHGEIWDFRVIGYGILDSL